MPSRNQYRLLTLGLLCATTAAVAQSQDGEGGFKPEWKVEPKLGLNVTVTDNLGLQTADSNKDRALVTTLSPGVRIVKNGRNLRGSLDYTLNGLAYFKSDRGSQLQNSLTGQALAELIDNVLFVDVQAGISQQSASVFGQQFVDSKIGNLNRSEVYRLGVSPYLRGVVPGVADYELRANVVETNAKKSINGDSRSANLTMRLDGTTSRLLKWSTLASVQRFDYKAGRDNTMAQLTGTLHYKPHPDIELAAMAGAERSDFLATSKTTGATYGINGIWLPTVRTKVVADWQHHEYGNSHTLSFEHRMTRSAWRISDIESVVAGNGQGAAGINNNYDLLFLQLSSLEPDPVKRDLLVRGLLRAAGIDPDARTVSGFLAASPTLTRRREASFSLLGIRSTLTFIATHSRSRRLDAASELKDDLGESAFVMQRGVTVNASHRFTPDSSASMVVSALQSRGQLAGQSTDMYSVTANWTSRLGARTNAVLGARRTHFNSVNLPYRENAVLFNLLYQF